MLRSALRHRRRLATAQAAVVSMLLAGCGSSYAKHDFIAAADAICASSLRQARALEPPALTGSADSQARQLSAYLEKLLPIVHSELTQLRGLRRPSQSAGSRVVLEHWLRALAEDSDTLRALAEAAKHGESQGVTSAEATLRASPTASLAQSYGLSECAKPSPTVA